MDATQAHAVSSNRWLTLALLFASCRTLPDLPAVNVSEPGWTLKQGQAVWRRDRTSPEIAAIGTHPPAVSPPFAAM